VIGPERNSLDLCAGSCRRDRREFGEWRQRLPVVRARALLEAGRSLKSIALDLGYGSSSAFIACSAG